MTELAENKTLQECSESSIQKAEHFLRKHFQTTDDRNLEHSVVSASKFNGHKFLRSLSF